jgi:hypothetical protein
MLSHRSCVTPERMSELSVLDFEVAAKRIELEEIEGRLKAIATKLGGGADATV